MNGHVRRDGDTVRLVLEPFEIDMLRSLHSGMLALLNDPNTDDPVVQRLFPACVDGDEEADAELRRLIFQDLLEQRRGGLDALEEILKRAEPRRGHVRIDLHDDEPGLLLGVLNDVRLTLGYRIGIEELDRDEIDQDDEIAPTLAVMDHLAWIQEQLLRIIDPPSVEDEPA